MVRAYAADSGNEYFAPHVRERMIERANTLPQVFEVLQKGLITEGPFLNARRNWQATMMRHVSGDRVEVVVAVDAGVIVVTVYEGA